MAVSQSELRVLLTARDEASAALRSVSQSAIKAADDIGRLSAAATSQLGNATRSVNDFGSAVRQGIGIGVGVGAIGAAFSAIGAGVGAAKGSIIDFNATMEQSQIAFTTMFDNARKASTGISDLATSGREAQNFLAQLQQFAQRTPFDLPSVVDGARRLQAMGFSAQQTIPLLTDLGNATSALGGNAQTLDRLVLALGQMQAKGKVSGEEMRQLAEAGIPAWRILAEAMGKSQAEVMKLSESGQIASATFINAFHQFAQNNWGNMMEAQSQTFSVGARNIRESLTTLVAGGFEPVFEIISRATVGLANFLQSSQVLAFGRDVQATMADIVRGVEPIEGAFNRAFAAFNTGGMQAALGSLMSDLQDFGRSLFGAGYDAVSEFAQGFLSGAGDLIAQAAEAVATVIASFLIGQSPPPQGPLSQIDQGGEATAAAWVEGFGRGAAGLSTVVQGVADTLGNVTKELSLSQAAGNFEQATGNLRAMQAVGTDVAGVLRNLGGVLREAQSDQRDLANQARDIKDAYDTQIQPLERQIQSLKDVGSEEARNLDLAQRQADLKSRQADIEDKAALNALAQRRIAAEGDPRRRAELQAQLDASREAEKGLQLNQRAQDLARQINEQEQKRAEAKAKGKPFDDKEYATRIALLRNQQQQLGIERQIAGVGDKRALAQIKVDEEAIRRAQDQRHLQEQTTQLANDRARAEQDIARAQREQTIAGLEQQVRGLKQEREDALAPVLRQEESVRRTIQAVQEEQGEWRALASAISAAETAQRQREAQAKADAKANALAGLGATPLNLPTQAITDAAQQAGTSFASSLRDSIARALPGIVGGGVGAAFGSTFGPLGAIAGAAAGATFGSGLSQALAERGIDVSVITRTLGDAGRTAIQAFMGNWRPPSPEEWVAPFIGVVGVVSSRIGELFRQAQGGDIGGAILAGLGDVGALAGRIAGWIGDAIGQIEWGVVWARASSLAAGFASWIGTQVVDFATWLGTQVSGIQWDAVWAQAVSIATGFGTWLTTQIVDFATWLGAQVTAIKWDDVWNKAVAVFDGAAMWFGDAAVKLAGWIGGQVSQIKWADVWNQAVDAVSGMAAWFASIAGMFGTWIGEQVATIKWDEVWNHVTDAVSGMKALFTDLGTRMTTWISQAAGQVEWGVVWSAAGAKLSTDVRNLAASLTSGLVSALRNVDSEALGRALATSIGAAWVAVRETIAATIVGAIQGGIVEVPYRILRIIAGLFVGIGKTIWEAFRPGAEQFTQQATAAFTTAGNQISAGVTKGIRDGSIEAQAAARDDLARGLSDSFAGALGIRSPSTVFIQHGTDLVDGLTQGITASAPQAAAAMQAIADQLTQITTDTWQQIWQITMDGLDAIWGAIGNQTAAIVGAVTELATAIADATDAGWQGAWAASMNGIQAIWGAIRNRAPDVVGAVQQMMAQIATQADAWEATGRTLGQRLVAGAQGAMQTLSLSSLDADKQARANYAAQTAAASGLPADRYVAQLLQENGLSTDTNPNSKDARGIAQFTPETAQSIANQMGVTIEEFWSDWRLQVQGSVLLMKQLTEKYKGDFDRAMSAYYSGEGGGVHPEYTSAVNARLSEARSLIQGAPAGSPQLMSNITRATKVDLSRIDPKLNQNNAGFLSAADAANACGPAATMLFMQAMGRPLTAQEALTIGTRNGWTRERGAGGTQAQTNAINAAIAQTDIRGVTAVVKPTTTENARAALAAGSPVGVSTTAHYFVGRGMDEQGKIDVGATNVFDARTRLTLAEMDQLGHGLQGLIVLEGDLKGATDDTLMQMGPGFQKAADDAQTLASSATDATDAVGSIAPAAADAMQATAGLGDAADSVSNIAPAMQDAADATAGLGDAADQAAGAVDQSGQDAAAAMAGAADAVASSDLPGVAAEQVQGVADAVGQATDEIPSGLQDGIDQAASTVSEGLDQVAADAAAAAANVGIEIVNGATDAIDSAGQALVDAAAAMIADAITAMREEAGVASPSKKAYEIGAEIVAGFNRALADPSTSERARGLIQRFLDAASAYAGVADNAADVELKLLDLKLQEARAQQALLPGAQAIAAAQQQQLPIASALARAQLALLPAQQAAAAQQRQQLPVALALAQAQLAVLPAQQAFAAAQRQQLPIALQLAQAQLALLPAQQAVAAAQRNQLPTALALAQAQRDVLPITQAVAAAQREIEDIQRGSLADQLQLLDVSTRQAEIRREQIGINARLRQAGKDPTISQEEINALQIRSEALKDQSDNLNDQAELQGLNAQIASRGASAALLALQDQERQAQRRVTSLQNEQALQQANLAVLQAALAVQEATLAPLQEQQATQQANLAVLQAQLQIQEAQLAPFQEQQATQQANLAVLQAQLAIQQAALAPLQEQQAMMQAQLAVLQAEQAERQASLAAIAAQTAQLQAQQAVYAAQLAIVTNLRSQLEEAKLITDETAASTEKAAQSTEKASSSISKAGGASKEAASSAHALQSEMKGIAPAAVTAGELLNLATTGMSTDLAAVDDSAAEMANDVTTTVTDMGTAVVTRMTDTGNQVTGAVVAANGQVLSAYANLNDGTQLSFSTMQTGITTKVTDTGNGMVTRMQDASGRYIGVVTDTSGRVLNIFATTETGVSTSMSRTSTNVSNSAATMTSNVSTSADGLQRAVSTASTQVGTALGALPAAFGGVVTAAGAADRDTGASAGSIARNWQQASTQVGSALGSLPSAFGTATSAASTAERNMGSSAGGVTRTWQQAGKDVGSALGALPNAFDGLGKAAQGAEKQNSNSASAIAKTWAQAAKEVGNSLSQMGEAIKRGASSGGGEGRASGGIAEAFQATLVGEHGPEILLPARRSMVLPATQTAAIMDRLRRLDQLQPGSGGGPTTVQQRIVNVNTEYTVHRRVDDGSARVDQLIGDMLRLYGWS